MQTKVCRGTATNVIRDASGIRVKYHNTIVATKALDGTVTLNSGGWRTNTTKTRINQLANEFCNGTFAVYQRKFDWYVRMPDGTECEFYDGIAFPAARIPAGWDKVEA